MIVEHIYRHPDDTPEERRARVQEIVAPFFEDMIRTRPEYAQEVLYAEKTDADGNVYYENGYGEQMQFD